MLSFSLRRNDDGSSAAATTRLPTVVIRTTACIPYARFLEKIRGGGGANDATWRLAAVICGVLLGLSLWCHAILYRRRRTGTGSWCIRHKPNNGDNDEPRNQAD